MNKYKFVKEYEHHNLYINIKNNCKESFLKDENPNAIAAHEEEVRKIRIETRAKQKNKSRRWDYYAA